MSKLMRVSFKLLDLLVIFMMVFGSPMSAAAKVWTEPPDSPPGGTVIIYGNNEDDTLDQNWVAGETVTVVAIAPDGVYTDEFTTCTATVADGGSWSCQIVLPSDPAISVSLWNYTATSPSNEERGTFTIMPAGRPAAGQR